MNISNNDTNRTEQGNVARKINKYLKLREDLLINRYLKFNSVTSDEYCMVVTKLSRYDFSGRRNLGVVSEEDTSPGVFRVSFEDIDEKETFFAICTNTNGHGHFSIYEVKLFEENDRRVYDYTNN
jgi:hypothetical protein